MEIKCEQIVQIPRILGITIENLRDLRNLRAKIIS